MALPTLDSLTAAMDRVCADVLGEAIQYRAAGTAGYSALPAHVDYRDGMLELGGAQLTAQRIRVALLRADVVAKPSRETRLVLPKLAAKIFRPVNVVTDESGTHWEFDCEEVTDG